jgi:hypothetical protein
LGVANLLAALGRRKIQIRFHLMVYGGSWPLQNLVNIMQLISGLCPPINGRQ